MGLNGNASQAHLLRLTEPTPAMPKQAGLYRPEKEKDSCGVGFIAQTSNEKSHKIVEHGLEILENLTHRGAVGADELAGDGAGIMVQMPDRFFREEMAAKNIELPAMGSYAVGQFFMPKNAEATKLIIQLVEAALKDEGLQTIDWREVPVDNSSLGKSVLPTEPDHFQLFIKCPNNLSGDAFERKLLVARKVVNNRVLEQGKPDFDFFYIVSMSARTIVYKGMFLAFQLRAYFPDLSDERFESALALVHQRFSTNTFPEWRLAHPYRMLAQNGEINTLRGNVNWMAARQASVQSELFGEDINKLWPISYEGQSDTACFDNALEFLVQGGYSLSHAMMTLIPEAWAGNSLMDENRRAFYEYHAAIMEPWDGPAAMAFTDGRQIGASLDRNGLRPARYLETDDGLVLMASEMGVLPIEESRIVRKWRLEPGKMLLVDLEKGKIISDDELKAKLVKEYPYKNWLAQSQIFLEELPDMGGRGPKSAESLLNLQQSFGYTEEELQQLMIPMAVNGQESIGAMGTDTPISALSNKSKLLYSYFKQNFAQVTNPPIDPIREESVMSLVSFIGPRPNVFDLEKLAGRKRLEVKQPILTNDDLEKIRSIGDIADNDFLTITLDITVAIQSGLGGMKTALDALCQRAESAVSRGYNIIVLSDRLVTRNRIALPALLATAAVHNHLIRKGLRTSVGLVVETGEAREIHHFCVLAGYGAEAVNPYLAFETLIDRKDQMPDDIDYDEIVKRYIKSINKGILKVMSKMGISTYQSYCGAQIFDAVGLASDFIEQYFFGTSTQIEGIGLDEVLVEALMRHHNAFGNNPIYARQLDIGGEYAFRIRGESHVWQPETVAKLQHAARTNNAEDYAEYARLINDHAEETLTIRGLFDLKSAESLGRKAVDISEVEPAAEIVKRFATGAMSFGSISKESHSTLAVAMNRIGGKSNTGEGGEDPDRFITQPNGDSQRSAIKQVASGRFGVTAEYLVNSDMIQIKVAQGAKPGEGGQLPGHKVDAIIAKTRHSTKGVGLISPPPHHDIYSIEDLAQLIYDLKNVNSSSDISVKLVSEVGVGTVAAGVAKAKADHITIAGYDGGTGASPLTSIKNAGSPWEMGLAETHQTLVMNGLRSRVCLQVDGGLRTGRDVIIGALLGADEFGFATAPLIAAGCIMMRKCHLNTCPVGIATQDPVLRRRFKGQPEHVINYFFFVAEEVRQLMAGLGITKFEELVGQSDLLVQRDMSEHWKAQGLDLSQVSFKPESPEGETRYHSQTQSHDIYEILDRKLVAEAQVALEEAKPVKIETAITNVTRSAGAMLAGEVAKRYGHAGLPDDTISVSLKGTAGQSFGAFLASGITFDLQGEGNDYVGKGLSGGRIVIRPTEDSKIVPEQSMIVGNTVLYGAVAGECYFNGIAGERFAVRNSGALAVVEGVGDHGCEYMTGGIVAVIGKTGRNFAAGMSGGIAYILDEEGDFSERCNLSMVDLEPLKTDPTLEANALEGEGQVDVSSDLTRFDEERLRQMIARHFSYTGSPRAKVILDQWQDYRMKFVKVMPVEYRRVLMETASQTGNAKALHS